MTLFAETDWPQTLQGIGILIAAASTAYLAGSKLIQENKEKQASLDEKQSTSNKADRNGVLAGEREYSERLEKQVTELVKEVKGLREQITELYEVIHKMQKLGADKDETAATQTAQIIKLQETVLTAKDETKEASVKVARIEGEKAGAATQSQANPSAPASVTLAMKVEDMKVDKVQVRQDDENKLEPKKD